MAESFNELIAKSYTGTVVADQAAIIPEVLGSQLEPNLRKQAVLQQSVVENTDLLGQPGSSVFIPVLADIGTVAPLTEGTDVAIVKLDNSDSIEFTPTEVGLGMGITRKALDRIKFDGVALIVSNLAYAMSLYLEGGIAGLYSAHVGSDSAAVIPDVYPNDHDDTDVVITDKFSPALLQEAVTQLEEIDAVPFDDGLWQLYLSPRQYLHFITDDDVRNDIRFSQPQVLLRGEMGVWNNVRIIKTTHIKAVAEGSADGITVHKALLVSPRWAAIAWKRRPEIVLDPTLHDFGRERRFAILADMTMGLLHNERARVISSAVGLEA